MSDIRRFAAAKFGKHKLESALIGILTGILLAAVLILSIINPLLLIVILPFLFFPIFFSGYFNHLSLNFDDKISFGNTFKYFGLFFRQPFRNSFKGIVSFAKAFLIGAATFMTASFIVSGILTKTSPEFVAVMTEFNTFLETDEPISYDAIYAILEAHNGLLNNFIIWTLVPSVGIGFIMFLIFITYNSLTIYLKVNVQTNSPAFYPYLLKEANKLSNKKILKDFFALNWPLFLLAALGFAGGAILAFYLNRFDFTQIACCGLVGGMLLSSFFLPFFFNNMEIIHEYYSEDFKKASDEINKNMLSQLQNSLKISEEQQEQIRKALEELQKAAEEKGKNEGKNDVNSDEN